MDCSARLLPRLCHAIRLAYENFQCPVSETRCPCSFCPNGRFLSCNLLGVCVLFQSVCSCVICNNISCLFSHLGASFVDGVVRWCSWHGSIWSPERGTCQWWLCIIADSKECCCFILFSFKSVHVLSEVPWLEENLVLLRRKNGNTFIQCVCFLTWSPLAGFSTALSQTPSISSISSEGREDLQVNQLETQIWIKPDIQKTDVDFSEILNAIQESKLFLGCKIVFSVEDSIEMHWNYNWRHTRSDELNNNLLLKSLRKFNGLLKASKKSFHISKIVRFELLCAKGFEQ